MAKARIALLIALLGVAAAQADSPALHGRTVEDLVATARGTVVPRAGGLYLVTDYYDSGHEASSREDQLHMQGYQLLGHLGERTAIVFAYEHEFIRKPDLHDRLVEFRPEWKFEAELYGAPARRTRELDLPLVVHATTIGAEETIEQMRALLPAGAELTEVADRGHASRIGLRIPRAAWAETISAIASLDSVFTLTEGTGAKLLNVTARRAVQSGNVGSGGETLWARGIRGEGQVLCIFDTGADYSNCYHTESTITVPPTNVMFNTGNSNPAARRIIAYNMLWASDSPLGGFAAYESQGHGTWVSANATGSLHSDPFGTGDTNLNGVAPAAKLVIHDGGYQVNACADMPAIGCPVVDITPHLELAYAQGARIHNNSWGDQEDAMPQNNYTLTCQDMDDMMWRNPEFLMVCAAGNSGPGINTVGSPSVSKNVVSVGGTLRSNIENVISFSSRGWAQDGRIKPDVTAPASTTVGDWSGSGLSIQCTTTTVQGTSMASPVTAGALALLRQYFTDGYYPSGTATPTDSLVPSGALLKAVLINGTAPMGGESAPPTRGQGWGRVNLERALSFNDEAQNLIIEDEWNYFTPGSPAFQTTFTSTGNTSAGEIAITLAWSDAPALVGANPAIVNNLNLVVTDPNGNTYLGNRFDTSTGLSITGGTADAINTVEKVRRTAVAGTWTVQVIPATILVSGQGFALAITGDVARAEDFTADVWMLY